MVLQLGQQSAAPRWADLELELLAKVSEGCLQFFDKYFDAGNGYGLWTPRWGGNDGPDDGAENQLGWTVLHALGAPDAVLERFHRGWEGHLRQYTEAHTIEASPAAREGMYYREWPAQFDYFHNEEGMSAFTLQGLSEPHDSHVVERTRRYAELYMGSDPTLQLQNYDKEHKLVRSLFTGSRGPLMVKARGIDWAGDQLVLPTDGGYGFRRPGKGGRVVDVPELLAARDGFEVGHHEESFEQMIQHFEEYTDVVGDHPLNLGTTTQVANAFMLTGESRYKSHVLEYIEAWAARCKANGGIIPSNVGLDGVIGSAADGRWYGGAYGWGFNCVVPQTGVRTWRSVATRRAAYGFGNAYLLSGNPAYLQVWRDCLAAVNANAKQDEATGETLYPRYYGAFPGEEPGWAGWSATPFSDGAPQLYFWSQDERDLQWLSDAQREWFDFLASPPLASAELECPYAEALLERGLSRLGAQLEAMAADPTTPSTRLSDDINAINPGTNIDALLACIVGSLPMGKNGCLLHCRLRFFDPARARAGLPNGIAALIEAMDHTTTTLSLCNTTRATVTVVVQGGAYAEHRLLTVSTDGGATTTLAQSHTQLEGVGQLSGSAVAIAIGAGCAGRVLITMDRYAVSPTLAFPWEQAAPSRL